MPLSPAESAAAELLDRIEEVLIQAEKQEQPVEVDPHRSRLFELFVMADAMGGLAEDADPDLSADGVARSLARRWNMAAEMGAGILQPSQLPPGKLARLRTLWSFMRVWMEWAYAWSRWHEFHASNPAAGDGPA